MGIKSGYLQLVFNGLAILSSPDNYRGRNVFCRFIHDGLYKSIYLLFAPDVWRRSFFSAIKQFYYRFAEYRFFWWILCNVNYWCRTAKEGLHNPRHGEG
jgi:hypothetical protein